MVKEHVTGIGSATVVGGRWSVGHRRVLKQEKIRMGRTRRLQDAFDLAHVGDRIRGLERTVRDGRREVDVYSLN